MEKRFWVGGYSPDGGGTSLGIRAMGYTKGVLTDLGLAHAAESPSWLATHPRLPVLYAALEHRGEVAAYRILGHNKLEPLGKPKLAGALLCHLVEHPSGFIYVVTEHSAEIITLRADAAGVYLELCRTGLGEMVLAGSDFPAEISLDTNNDRLYVGVRGAGIVAVLDLVSGRPVFRGSGSCAGAWPRHHVQVGNSLLVANQLSNTIEAIGLEGADGLPQDALSSLPMESPTCIAAQVTV